MELNIVTPGIETYLNSLLPQREAWFIEMEEIAAREDFPAVGPQVGAFLELMARSVGARRVMELGSGFGYSGLWFCKAMPKDGYILLSDFDEKNETAARKFFKAAGMSHLMAFHTGDALTMLNLQLELVEKSGAERFDVIFNDVEKELYPKVIEPVFRLLRRGGLFITDNALWMGKVAQGPVDETTAAVLEFNERMKAHQGFLTSWLPLRDGLAVAVKL